MSKDNPKNFVPEAQYNEMRVKLLKEYKELGKKLDKAIKAMRLVRDTAYSSTQDCPKCAFIDDLLTKALREVLK